MSNQSRHSSQGGAASVAPSPDLAERGVEAVPPRNARPAQSANVLDHFLNPLIAFFTSLRLTVVCLVLGLVVVFFGTMAQDPIGLYLAQEKFFRSFFVTAAPMWAAIKKTLEVFHVYLPPSTAMDVLHGSKVPVFPGGYLIGGLLLLNLLASHFKRFSFNPNKAGIWMVHAGLILLLLGQLGTDFFSRETALHLRNGEAKNYSETQREVELAVVDVTDADADKVVAVPQGLLMSQKVIRHPEMPFAVHVKAFYPNSVVENLVRGSGASPAATQGVGTRTTVKEQPRVTDMEKRDIPSAVVEVVPPQGPLGTWLVSEYIDSDDKPQRFTFNNRVYQIALRPRRYYKPYSIQLVKFQHDVYPGTEIPKNFSSRVMLERPETGEKREVLIYMNNPLRYAGETYYQASFDPDNQGSILQVVHNPSWVTPYFSCVLVGIGLVVQFAIHLFGFTFKRKPA
jgi:hypothetical protein